MKDLRSGIYIIRCLIDNKILIGSTNCMYRRYFEHFSLLRENLHYNVFLQESYNRHGEENFTWEVVEECEESLLFEREQYYFNNLLFAQEYILNKDSRFQRLGFNIIPIAGSNLNKTVPVVKADLEGTVLKIYSSIKEAVIDTLGKDYYYGVNKKYSEYDAGIGVCIRGLQITAFGYLWVHYTENLEEIQNMIEEKVVQLKTIEQLDSKTGERIAIFKSIGEAEKSFGLLKGTALLDSYTRDEKDWKGYTWRILNKNRACYYAAIDVGKDGGISFLKEDGSRLFSSKIPSIGDEIDINKICQLLRNWRKYIRILIIEDVHSIYGASAKSNFQFGRSLGIVEAAVISFKIPFLKVTPKTWQKVSFQGVPEQKKIDNTNDTKLTALIAATRLFPSFDFRATERSKKPHDGMVDSALIAWYGKVTNL